MTRDPDPLPPEPDRDEEPAGHLAPTSPGIVTAWGRIASRENFSPPRPSGV